MVHDPTDETETLHPAPSVLNRSLVLVGFMGAGKSTVGRALASRWGWRFVDSDDVLVERFGAIADQFAEVGEAEFRSREAAVLAELPSQPGIVVATGGGALEHPHTRSRLTSAFFMVFLRAPLQRLAERVAGSARPAWDDAVQARFERRQSAYASAHLIVDTADRSVDEVVGCIERGVRTCGA